MSRNDPVELLSGAVIFAIGAFFFFGAAEYPMGTLSRMGPGYLPRAAGGIGMGLGVLIALTAVGRPGDLPRIAWRPLAAILAAILAFALVLPRAGLVPASYAAALIAILGNREARPVVHAALPVAIAAICWAIFIAILGLPIPAMWWGV